jgi:hypothetical protein
MGEYVSQGLALGIESEQARVAKAAQALAAAALPDVGTVGFDLSGSADAAISRSLSVAAAQRVQLELSPALTGDWFQDGLKRNIKARNNGDVLAALAS